MTTTQLINLLKSIEFGASGSPREISFTIPKEDLFFTDPSIEIDSTGDGIAGAELTLRIER